MKQPDYKLLEILVCPLCKAKLEKQHDELICNKCKLAYPIDNGIPVMLIENAREINND